MGSDTASYAGSQSADDAGVTVNLATGEGSGDDAGGYTLDVNGDTIYKGDTLVGIENLVGSDHDDTLRGNREVNIIDGGNGDDMLYGGGGGDTLTGGAGDDTLYGGGHDDTLTGGTGEDTLYGHKGDDTLEGGIGADTLEGGTGADTLQGGAGADTYVFRSGDGADTISGEGAETILVDGNDVVVVNRLTFKDATGFDDFSFSRNDANDVVIEVGDDSVTILAAAYADGRYSIHYGDSDTALGRLAIGTTGDNPSLTGTDDADLMLGLAGDDTLTGDAGDDTLYGGGGGDTLTGGAGDDTLYGGGHGDTLTGGTGEDTLYGHKGDDTLEGGIGADFLDGGDGIDTASYANSDDEIGEKLGVTVNLATGEGSGDDAGGYTLDVNGDTIYKGDTLVGIENLIGSDHHDTLRGNSEVNIIDGGNGDDMLYGGGGGDTLTGGAGDDTLYGGGHDDTLTGGTGEDTLYGHKGDDTLEGGIGADTLEGGTGADTLQGGAGADTYVFRSGDGADTISGEGAETIPGEGDDDVVVNKLTFKDAMGFDDFSFSRDADNNVVIEVGDDSVTILVAAYADGRYSIHYGDSDTALGRLAIGTTGDNPSLTGTDDADLMLGLAGDDTLEGGIGADLLGRRRGE